MASETGKRSIATYLNLNKNLICAPLLVYLAKYFFLSLIFFAFIFVADMVSKVSGTITFVYNFRLISMSGATKILVLNIERAQDD